MFILRETLRFLRHNLGAWVMACITLGVALGVSGLFAMLAWQAHRTMSELRSNLAIEAFFDPGISSSAAESIVQERIDSLPGISRVTFISKEAALSDYTASSGENVEDVLGMNPLPASIKLYLKDPSVASAQTVQSSLRSVRGIEEVRGSVALLKTMESRSRSLDTIAIMLSSLLLISALFYALLAGMHSLDNSRETLRTFDLLGATRFTSLAPIVLASSAAGIIGGALGWVLTRAIQSEVRGSLNAVLVPPVTTQQSIPWLGILMATGLLIGMLGAVLSAARKHAHA